MQEAWIRRRFVFDLPVDRIGTLLSRLRGTQHRIAALVRGVPAATLTRRAGDKWSVQEHVGHLHDLEALHQQRLHELAAGTATLSAADMDNRATWAAGHNEVPFANVFARFVASRDRLVASLARLDRESLARHAVHPRLQQAMRAIDVAFFTAEHDDHHLAAIEALLAAAGPPEPAAAVAATWSRLPSDAPTALLERRRVIGNEAMISHITLHRGCVVPTHAHANEQFACVLSGLVRFVLADGEQVLGAGDVLYLPSQAPHSAEAIETAVVLDVFAPPSATTGIDERRG
ncbi:MAG TPA: DinB family protein [Planctomycetota bacterium]|nr:DinB family protein [Planctomycetota bacterium]